MRLKSKQPKGTNTTLDTNRNSNFSLSLLAVLSASSKRSLDSSGTTSGRLCVGKEAQRDVHNCVSAVWALNLGWCGTAVLIPKLNICKTDSFATGIF